MKPQFTLTLVTALLVVFAPMALAKRAAPKKVKPVVANGIEYRAPLSVAKIGFVQAWDVAEKKLLWEKRIYSMKYIPSLERDVQWVFITGLELREGLLLVTNERGDRYSLDLKSKKVKKVKADQ